MAGLVTRGLRTICFAKSRRTAELVHRFTADRVDPEVARRLAPYRAGYTPAQRREIERRLVEGDLLGVSATDALELGIDIGELDAAISVGFPGTVASLRQQWGRAGRRGHGLAILIASEDALDQFFMRDPEALLSRNVEAARLDHANPRVLDGHVLSAAFEAPHRRRRPRHPRRRGTRARRGPPRAQVDARRLGLGRQGLPRGPNRAPLVVARLVHRRRRLDGDDPRRRRARARLLDRSRRRDLPPPRRPVRRARARPRRPHRGRLAVHRRLAHDGEEGDGHGDRRAREGRAAARARALVRRRRGDRAGDRLPEEDARRHHARDGPARPARDDVRDGGGLVPARVRAAAGDRGDAPPPRRASTPPSTR